MQFLIPKLVFTSRPTSIWTFMSLNIAHVVPGALPNKIASFIDDIIMGWVHGEKGAA